MVFASIFWIGLLDHCLCNCTPVRGFGSRVSGLVLFQRMVLLADLLLKRFCQSILQMVHQFLNSLMLEFKSMRTRISDATIVIVVVCLCVGEGAAQPCPSLPPPPFTTISFLPAFCTAPSFLVVVGPTLQRFRTGPIPTPSYVQWQPATYKMKSHFH